MKFAPTVHEPITPEKPVYVTQWAATKGILMFTGGKVEDGYFSYRVNCYSFFVHERDWTFDRVVAETRYQAALLKKVKSAEKQIASLRKNLDQRPEVKPWSP